EGLWGACPRSLPRAFIARGWGRPPRAPHLARSPPPQARIQGRLLGDEYRGPRNGVPATAKARLRASVTRYASRGAPRGTRGCCTRLSPAGASQNQLVGGRQLEARLEP